MTPQHQAAQHTQKFTSKIYLLIRFILVMFQTRHTYAANVNIVIKHETKTTMVLVMF